MYIVLIVLNFISIFLLRKLLIINKILDHPSALKSHKIPTPKGSGISIFITTILITIYYILSNFVFEHELFISQFLPLFLICFVSLGLVTLYDDFIGLHHIWRLLIQIIIIFLLINSFYLKSFSTLSEFFIFYVPKKIWFTIFFIFWLFNINATNFIDGIDGNFSFYGICTSLFYSVFFYINNFEFFYHINLGILLSFSVMFFFNLSKKFKIFSGDIGTILYGLILSINFTVAALNGYLASIFILHFYVFIDVGSTLIIKIFKRENIFVRHQDFLFFKIKKRNNLINFIINFTLLILALLTILY